MARKDDKDETMKLKGPERYGDEYPRMFGAGFWIVVICISALIGMMILFGGAP
jgi:hypothetical protein